MLEFEFFSDLLLGTVAMLHIAMYVIKTVASILQFVQILFSTSD